MKTQVILIIKVLACLLFLVCSPARAQQVSQETGDTLLEACESKTEFRQSYCFGYITGVADIEGMEAAVFPDRRRACRAEGVTNGQIKDVVVKYLKEHPEDRHFLAAILVMQAMAKAFPCKQTTP